MDRNSQSPALDLYSISLRRRFTKNFVEILLLFMTVLILIPLFSILYEILSKGLPVLINVPDFLVNNTAGPSKLDGTGLANAFIGSVVVTFTASILTIPIGILAGIYLAGINSNSGRYASIIRLIADVLQSTPSIVAGLVIVIFWVIPNRRSGSGVLAGGMALGILMLPIVARVTEEGIRTVPSSINEAALALGIPEWRIMLTIILRAASSIVMTGIMLSIARVAGETAPLLFTMGDSDYSWGWNKFSPSLTIKIYKYATSSDPVGWIPAAWAMATVLLVFVFGINIIIRTNVANSLWQNPFIKTLIAEFAILGAMVSVEALFGDVVLMLTFGIVLRIILLNELSNKDLLFKIFDFKVADIIPIGKIAILAFILEMFGEIILFVLNIKTNILYVINYRLSMLIIAVSIIYYLNTFIKSHPTPVQILKKLLDVTFLLMLLEIAVFQFGGSNYYIGDIIYFVILFNIFLRLMLYYPIVSSKETYQKLSSNSFTRMLAKLEVAEVTFQVVIYILHYILNIVLHLNIYLFINYIYKLNYYLTYVLITILVIFYVYQYFKKQKSNRKRVRSIVVLLVILNLIDFVYPLADGPNSELSQIIFGLLLKTILLYIILSNKSFTSFKETLVAKGVFIFVVVESVLELILLGLNYSTQSMTTAIFNLNYLMVIILLIYAVYLFLIRYKVIKPNVTANV